MAGEEFRQAHMRRCSRSMTATGSAFGRSRSLARIFIGHAGHFCHRATAGFRLRLYMRSFRGAGLMNFALGDTLVDVAGDIRRRDVASFALPTDLRLTAGAGLRNESSRPSEERWAHHARRLLLAVPTSKSFDSATTPALANARSCSWRAPRISAATDGCRMMRPFSSSGRNALQPLTNTHQADATASPSSADSSAKEPPRPRPHYRTITSTSPSFTRRLGQTRRAGCSRARRNAAQPIATGLAHQLEGFLAGLARRTPDKASRQPSRAQRSAISRPRPDPAPAIITRFRIEVALRVYLKK